MGNNPISTVDPDGGCETCPRAADGSVILPEVQIFGQRGGSNWWNSAPSSFWGGVGMSANMAMYREAVFPATNGEAFKAYMTYVAFVSTSQESPGRVGSPIKYPKVIVAKGDLMQ
jgi:hypothetical protein